MSPQKVYLTKSPKGEKYKDINRVSISISNQSVSLNSIRSPIIQVSVYDVISQGPGTAHLGGFGHTGFALFGDWDSCTQVRGLSVQIISSFFKMEQNVCAPDLTPCTVFCISTHAFLTWPCKLWHHFFLRCVWMYQLQQLMFREILHFVVLTVPRLSLTDMCPRTILWLALLMKKKQRPLFLKNRSESRATWQQAGRPTPPGTISPGLIYVLGQAVGPWWNMCCCWEGLGQTRCETRGTEQAAAPQSLNTRSVLAGCSTAVWKDRTLREKERGRGGLARGGQGCARSGVHETKRRAPRDTDPLTEHQAGCNSGAISLGKSVTRGYIIYSYVYGGVLQTYVLLSLKPPMHFKTDYKFYLFAVLLF